MERSDIISNKNGEFFMCENCNKEFYRSLSRIKRGSVKYCCKICADVGLSEIHSQIAKSINTVDFRSKQRKGVYVKCPICEKDFYKMPSKSKKYCSKECFISGEEAKLREMAVSQRGPNFKNTYLTRNGMREHRWVMEQHLGRRLKSEEVVHHIDHDRHNNKIDNLILFANESEHQKFHIKETRIKKGVLRSEIRPT